MLSRITLLRNQIQRYAWGSNTAIPELLGEKPDGHPQAEMWMGAHPGAPSEVELDGVAVPLDRVIQSDPEKILGEKTAKKFGNQLPFLFKVLAADMPLSIQAHPDKIQAKRGFERENAAGVAMTSGVRNLQGREPQTRMYLRHHSLLGPERLQDHTGNIVLS
jgi:mannose-6-phosphate isomerase